MEKLLLPSGLYDLLPPEAQRQGVLVHTLLSTFSGFGYEQVNPPLMEYEDSLFAGRGESLSEQTFRVMDPASRKMMGIRSDMTYQIGRIATTRMGNAAKPLRLCYAGQVLLMKGDTFNSERERLQAGIELIGSTSPTADTEVILVAVEALEKTGINGITVDLGLPGLVRNLLIQQGVAAEDMIAIEDSVIRKDLSGLKRYGDTLYNLLSSLIRATGSLDTALATLQALALPESAKAQIAYVAVVAQQLKRLNKDFSVTVDAAESRGFEYHKTISFSVFAAGARSEVARGGRYEITQETGGTALEATGVTLYVNSLLKLAPSGEGRKRVFIPLGTKESDCTALRDEGYATVYALAAGDTGAGLGCSYKYENGKVVSI